MPGAVAEPIVDIAVAARAAKGTGPTGGLQRLGALRLGAKAAKEFGQGHAGLELDSVEDHGCALFWTHPGYEVSATWHQPAEACFLSSKRLQPLRAAGIGRLLRISIALPMTSSTVPHLPLVERLKSGTAVMHRRVERSAFMSGLLHGEIERGSYLGYLHNLRAMYEALEAALLRQSADPAIAPVVLPELFRCRALDLDIQVLGGAQAGPDPVLRPAAIQYVERLDELDATAPALLVAHAYVRYLGDLNGGQALRRIVARGLRLQGGAGTMFYDFGDDALRRQLIGRFRNGLAAVEVRTPDVDAIVAEAVSAFERHEAIFEQLACAA